MKSHLRYLSYVLRHKWFVFVECCRVGMPLRGLAHDLSKFTPREWFPYVERFYGSKPFSRDVLGGHNPYAIGGPFDFAWLAHVHHNPHHWQYWILLGDKGWTKALVMPEAHRKEMMCDWKGAGLAQGKPDVRGWYLSNCDKMELHPETRAWIERMLDG